MRIELNISSSFNLFNLYLKRIILGPKATYFPSVYVVMNRVIVFHSILIFLQSVKYLPLFSS